MGGDKEVEEVFPSCKPPVPSPTIPMLAIASGAGSTGRPPLLATLARNAGFGGDIAVMPSAGSSPSGNRNGGITMGTSIERYGLLLIPLLPMLRAVALSMWACT
jgi:hypothetical protein